MGDSSDSVGVSATGVSRLAPHPLQNWASEGFSRLQVSHSIVELTFPSEWSIDKRMIAPARGRGKPYL